MCNTLTIYGGSKYLHEPLTRGGGGGGGGGGEAHLGPSLAVSVHDES